MENLSNCHKAKIVGSLDSPSGDPIRCSQCGEVCSIYSWQGELVEFITTAEGASMRGYMYTKSEEEIVDHVGRLIESAKAERVREVLEIITTHTEHEGGYCDTGEDMEWACRSDCVELAVKRLRNL